MLLKEWLSHFLSAVSKETVTKLRFNGITSFDDVMSVSEERIESVTSSRPPFGRNLKAAIRKTLARKLSLSATLESSENGGTALQLRLVENDVNSITQNSVPSAEKDAAVEFTLIAYTEKECLIYKKVDDALELKGKAKEDNEAFRHHSYCERTMSDFSRKKFPCPKNMQELRVF